MGKEDQREDPRMGPEVEATVARNWHEAGEAVLVDVREPFEYEYENIPGSVLVSLSFLDPSNFPALRGRKLVVFCAIGRRGESAQRQLAAAGWSEVYNMKFGIEGWIGAGFETLGKKEEESDYAI